MSACPMPGCAGTMARVSISVFSSFDAQWFVCDSCGYREHPASCVDEEGKVECVCGLEDMRAAERAAIE